MIKEKIGYSYNDLTIVPCTISDITSRSECNPFYKDNKLPIFASCMSTVVDDTNIDKFIENGITPIVPRNIPLLTRISLIHLGHFIAMSMGEFEDYFITNIDREFHNQPLMYQGKTFNVCIDIANGHMKKLYELTVRAKQIANDLEYNLIIMTGNIANPQTYKWICDNTKYFNKKTNLYERSVDYIRLSIGTGAQCTTSSNTSIHYPISTLIDECYKIKKNLMNVLERVDAYNDEYKYHESEFPKLVADGGIRNYSDVIKALALGADYVMIGSLFAGMYESAAPLIVGNYNDKGYLEYFDCDYQYTSEEKKRNDIKNRNLYKECYGMSTKKAQELIDPNKSKKTAEGKHSIIKVQYTINQWTENMIDYLKSAMSYCGARTLNEFISKSDLMINSSGAINSVNK